MVNNLSKKDISGNFEVHLLSKGSTEEMLMEFGEQMFHETIHDPLAGIHHEDHAGFALEMEDGLEFMHIRSKIPDDMTLIRQSHENKDRIAIYFFYGSTFDYQVENKMERSVEGLINGIIIHNYSSNVRLSLLKDHEFNFVVIRISKMILEKYFKSIADNLYEILFTKKPVLIYENLDQNVLDHLKSVGNIQSTKVASRYLIFGKSIELLALTFELLLTRSHESKNKVRIYQYDQIVKAKNYLISNWQNPPSIKALSQYMGMCPTKAKMLFKQVYGYPPHQYFKKKKLEMAYQLIRETDYDMSEIGQKLGYKNLSHFSADFKKHYGILPKKYSMEMDKSGSGN
jgi:AraC-like DNA-binding protein